MLRRFKGGSVHKVDQKGRVSVPAPFRRVIEEGDPDWVNGQNPNFVILFGRPGRRCLEGYTIQGAGEIDEMIAQLPRFSPDREMLERFMNTRSVYASLDETGRVLLAPKLRDQIGLKDEAFFAGMGDKFQIWTPEEFEADEARMADDIAAREIDPLMLLHQLVNGAGK